jgi:phosphoribosylformylglycinamidine cyclo-ligase
VAEGDVLLGLASDGVHSNGYSLVRRVVERRGWAGTRRAVFERRTLGAALLAPTRLYVPAALAAVRAGGVHALAHITGGGLTENLPRVLPEGLGAEIDLTLGLPPVFRWLQETGGIAQSDMLRTFNCGIGMVVVTGPAEADRLSAALTDAGETVMRIGTVTQGDGVRYRGMPG